MKKVNKLLIIFSAFALCACLAGCAGAKETSNETAGTSAEQTTIEETTSSMETTSEAETTGQTEETSMPEAEELSAQTNMYIAAETDTQAAEETTSAEDNFESYTLVGRQLAEEYSALLARISLDQVPYETTMGQIGANLAASEGELTDMQQSILNACAYTPAAAAHYCAAWIGSVFGSVGYYVGGNANDIWANYCYSNDLSELKPGMIIAVQHSRTDVDSDGYIYGHVGIYIGHGYVIHSTTVNEVGTKVITSLDDWLDRYDPYDTVMWGYPQ